MRLSQTLCEDWGVLLAVLLVAYLSHKLYVYSRLQYFKWPWGVGFTLLLQGKQLCGLGSFSWYEDVAEKYGPIALIGPNILLVSDPDILARIPSRAGYKKTDWWYKPS